MTTTAAVLRAIREATDSDGLVQGHVFDDLEQESVLVGEYWIGIDERLPWQFSQCARSTLDSLGELRLRLNLDRIEHRSQHLSPLRKAHWWGARFDWDTVLTRRRGFETRHADPDSQLQANGRPTQATFRWNFPPDEHVGEFQIEEFRDLPSSPSADPSTRYLHSILDLTARHFVHLDGAIKTYTRDEYSGAYRDGIAKAPKYEKLFRLDAPLHHDVWLAFVATFFPNDKLVREYFDASS